MSEIALLSASPDIGRGLRIEDWAAWWQAVLQTSVLGELTGILLAGGLAWLVTARLRQHWTRSPNSSGILLGRGGVDGALFPLLWLGAVALLRVSWLHWHGVAPFTRVVLPLLLALALVRTGVRVLRAAFPQARLVRRLERSISWLVWVAWVLWVIDVLPAMHRWASRIDWQVGGASLNLASLVNAVIGVAASLLLVLWLSSEIEARLLRGASGNALSMRKMVANTVRIILVFVAVLVTLTAVGIDLTALSVFSGALGVGIGLGLQRLAANYVSGFVILSEHRVRIGDLVRVGGFEGRVSNIRTRYTTLRSANSTEAIVPNEILTTTLVENLSLPEQRSLQSLGVSVAPDSDVEQVQALLCAAALQCPRVRREPAPSALLSKMGASGLEFTLTYWLSDPEHGTTEPRSQINMEALRQLRAHGIALR